MKTTFPNIRKTEMTDFLHEHKTPYI